MPAATPARDSLAGAYKIGGGDASIEIVRALTDAFAAKHPGMQFDIDTGLGSDPAVKLAADGTLDLGMASRELTADESALVTTTTIGAAGTALAVHAQNLVRTLSSAEVASIFSGKASDWSAFGGDKSTIVPLIREKGSSARTTFENVIFGGKAVYPSGVLEVAGGDQMRQSISGQRAAIGMIGVSSDDPAASGIRIVSIDGIAPSKATLRDGTYKLRRPLYLLSSKSVGLKPGVTAFIAFVNSADGQKILDRF
ncbi:MAG TPA: substrate-binding domain-containing protein [Candidatus Limnocylindrales bacterium]|nr:substrate-binding domain-containing protein [Candidatus Limnocylindrales bacterium]